MAFDIKKRKRELVRENVEIVPIAAHGKKLTKIAILSIIGLRCALCLFEIIYSSVKDFKISIWSYVLLIPFLFILYMLYDGNKSFVYIAMISAPIRLVYHFTVILPLIANEEISALTVASLIVFATQFFLSIYMSTASKCDAYFLAMQKVNLKLRAEMIGRK